VEPIDLEITKTGSCPAEIEYYLNIIKHRIITVKKDFNW
jgi:hypothetical protein